MRTFLVCISADHAHLVDQLVAEKLRDECGTHCTGWSGVYTNGTDYGILWASPVSDLFGVPEDFPELVLVEDLNDEWVTLPEPEPTDEGATL